MKRSRRLIRFNTARTALSVVLVAAGLVADAAEGQGVGFSKVLIPLYSREPLPGAQGSEWATELWLRNGATSAVEVRGYDYGCLLPECPPPPPLEPNVSFRPLIAVPATGFQGAFLYVEDDQVGRLTFGLRLKDLSRQSETWGTEVPVVPENEFRAEGVSLMDVPVSEGFRQVLRVYELDSTPREARIRFLVYRIGAAGVSPFGPQDELIGEATRELFFVPPGFSTDYYPGYVSLSEISSIASVQAGDRLRIEVQPVTPGLHIWAFVAIVNNETQHLTLVTPQ